MLKSFLNTENCLTVKLLAERFALKELYKEAVKFIAPKFLEISKGQELLEMPFDFVRDLLQELEFNYTREIDLFEMIEAWTKADYSNRKKHYHALISLLHIPYMTCSSLRECVLSSQLVKEQLSPGCARAMEVLATPGSGNPHKCEVVLCRTRSVKIGDPVNVLCYKVKTLFCFRLPLWYIKLRCRMK